MRKPFTVADFREQVKHGPYVWPGGYPIYFIMDDGEALSYAAAKENEDLIVEAIAGDEHGGWRVIGYEINWEDTDLVCIDTGNKIECAYSNEDN